MKLYNITYDLADTSTILMPKIPHSAGDGEDKITPRVCLADSISNCIQAFGSQYRDISKGAKFLIREVEVADDSDYLINPYSLKITNRVPDALENNEYWYTRPIKCNVKLAEVICADAEFTLAWTCIPIEKCRDIIKQYADINVYSHNNSFDLYIHFLLWAEANKKWNEMDWVYDELTLLPWSQKTLINNLKIKYL